MSLPFLLVAAHATVTEQVATTWRLVDYMAVDYADAVQQGQVVDAGEYEEMRTFARDIRARIEALPEVPPTLLAQVDTLEQDVEGKVDATRLRVDARALGDALLALHPIPTAPPSTPAADRGAVVFGTHCASCHGPGGRGDGPASTGMDPPPVDFTDPVRARQRSVFALYQVTTQGLEDTPMVGFTQLSDQERWDVATYVSTLAFPDRPLHMTPRLEALVPDLTRWASLTPTRLAEQVPEADADGVMGALRRHPEALERGPDRQLAIAHTRLAQSIEAWSAGEREQADGHALKAYLDGFEPVEPLLVAHPALLAEVEGGFNAYRAALRGEDPAPQLASLTRSLDQVERTLAGGSGLAIFLAATLLLVREGLEAILVVVAMLGMLRKTEQHALVPRVHAGWISALAAGGLTWWAATSLVTLTGAQRELIEGIGGVLAAIVLVSIGVWMHDKAVAGRWAAYVEDRVDNAVASGSGLGIAGLVFLVVYREAFETILFYTSLWAEGGTGPVLAGFLTGSALLAGLAWGLQRATSRLPLSQFFGFSAWLMSALAIVLAGKGIGGLQEAGLVGVTPVGLPPLAILGFNATLETLGAQLLTAIAVGIGVVGGRRG